MIGPVTSALAFASALTVARRTPQHGPIAAALGASLLCAAAVRLDAWYAPQNPSPRAALTLLGCVALASGWAYLKAWTWDPQVALALMGAIAAMVIGAVVNPERYWAGATWGPILVSVVVGSVAMARWSLSHRAGRYDLPTEPPPPERWTITRRIALVLLAADVAGLLFAAWPGVVQWQGRAAAVAVTVLQIGWLIRRVIRERRAIIIELLRRHGELTGLALARASDGQLRRGTVYVWLAGLEADRIIASTLRDGRRHYWLTNK